MTRQDWNANACTKQIILSENLKKLQFLSAWIMIPILIKHRLKWDAWFGKLLDSLIQFRNEVSFETNVLIEFFCTFENTIAIFCLNKKYSPKLIAPKLKNFIYALSIINDTNSKIESQIKTLFDSNFIT